MTIQLSPEQTQIYQQGFWDARHIEEDCIELADRAPRHEPVVVVDAAGTVLFALTPRR